MTAAGSRARSRELGYAEAMRDMSSLLDWKKRQYAAAGAGRDDEVQDICRLMGRAFGQLADYAHGASMAYELPDLGEFLADVVWHPRYGDPGPHETGSFPAVN